MVDCGVVCLQEPKDVLGFWVAQYADTDGLTFRSARCKAAGAGDWMGLGDVPATPSDGSLQGLAGSLLGWKVRCWGWMIGGLERVIRSRGWMVRSGGGRFAPRSGRCNPGADGSLGVAEVPLGGVLVQTAKGSVWLAPSTASSEGCIACSGTCE